MLQGREAGSFLTAGCFSVLAVDMDDLLVYNKGMQSALVPHATRLPVSWHMMVPYIGLWLQVRDAGSLLTAGGFNIPAVDVDDMTVYYKDMHSIVNHLR